MADTRRQEIGRIVNSIRLIKNVHAGYSRSLMRQHGITGQQLWALRIITSSPGISLGELSERMYLHVSTGSALVDRLAAKRHLVRDRSAEDRRMLQLRVTPRGRRIIARVPPSGFLAMMQDIDRLSTREIRHLGEAMKILLKVMRIEGDVDVDIDRSPRRVARRRKRKQ